MGRNQSSTNLSTMTIFPQSFHKKFNKLKKSMSDGLNSSNHKVIVFLGKNCNSKIQFDETNYVAIHISLQIYYFYWVEILMVSQTYNSICFSPNVTVSYISALYKYSLFLLIVLLFIQVFCFSGMICQKLCVQSLNTILKLAIFL